MKKSKQVKTINTKQKHCRIKISYDRNTELISQLGCSADWKIELIIILEVIPPFKFVNPAIISGPIIGFIKINLILS